ncbi:MAG: Dephospho-CoA kinase [Acidobacteria bacterium]|nr:Dephospho-CoA kinase [Acidobacteriota bacterium]
MLKVGLTGGIATGKSYVLSVLSELGCEAIDADTVAHQVIEPGRPAYLDIVNHFGDEILNEDGAINRAALGAIVFCNKDAREKLNAIVHPRVYEAQVEWLDQVARRDPSAIAVVDAALMIETGSYRRFDKLIVVYCDLELQVQRLMERNNFTREQAMSRISAQMPSEEKLKFADYAINTSDGFEDTRRQTENIYEKLRALYPATSEPEI